MVREINIQVGTVASGWMNRNKSPLDAYINREVSLGAIVSFAVRTSLSNVSRIGLDTTFVFGQLNAEGTSPGSLAGPHIDLVLRHVWQEAYEVLGENAIVVVDYKGAFGAGEAPIKDVIANYPTMPNWLYPLTQISPADQIPLSKIYEELGIPTTALRANEAVVIFDLRDLKDF